MKGICRLVFVNRSDRHNLMLGNVLVKGSFQQSLRMLIQILITNFTNTVLFKKEWI